jgi:2-dehydro-3-deoxyphosphogluconate aldolase/(4S)-4-hydroxy-2-oxoglutarate aldolase
MLYSNHIPTKENKFKMTNDELFTYFHDLGIVPVVKIDDANKAEGLAKAMIDGGLPCAEVTFRTDAAEEAIRRISAKYPDMMLGAGTVINPELAEKAVNAGAKFIVSPGLNPDTVKWCLDHNVPVVPGVATPSDIEKGLSLGLKVLKFFPAESSGGVKMLKDLGGPFPQVKFMTTGGISPDNLADYAKTPNVLAIGGSWMVKADLIESENWAEITRLCQEAVIKLQGLQLAHVGINLPDSDAAMMAFASFRSARSCATSSLRFSMRSSLCLIASLSSMMRSFFSLIVSSFEASAIRKASTLSACWARLALNTLDGVGCPFGTFIISSTSFHLDSRRAFNWS